LKVLIVSLFSVNLDDEIEEIDLDLIPEMKFQQCRTKMEQLDMYDKEFAAVAQKLKSSKEPVVYDDKNISPLDVKK
jgi:DNA-binding transcriptional regulator/RsmH inhibitor MraZ